MTEQKESDLLASLSEEARFKTIKAFYKKSEEFIQYIIYGSVAYAVLLAFWYDTWLLGIGISGLLVIIYLSSRYMVRLWTFHRHLVAVILPLFGAVFIYQMHGLFEIHFVYLIYATLLITYRDWRLYITFTIVTVLHHLLFAYLQNSGLESIYFSQLAYLGLTTMTFHIGLVALNVLFCGWWSKNMRKQALLEEARRQQLNFQLQNIDNNIRFAEEIAQGNLDAHFETSKEDIIGSSLLDMRQNLKSAAQEERNRNWATEGIATIEEILRLYNKNLEDLSFRVISTLTTYVKAIQGGIFILNDENDEDLHLELTGCIAYDRKKFITKRVEIGQGLVGQTFREKETLYMTKVPQDYVHITSGLGDTNPQSIIIIPLKMEEEVIGVIEMASFQKYSPHEIAFLEKVAESIASTVISSKNNERTAKLLNESQLLTEQMQAQEEEVRQNMEEMEATQEEMRRQQAELEKKENNLNALINNTKDSIITIDSNYVIMIINDVIKDRYKGTAYEAMQEGVNALDFLGDVRDEWKGYYDKALAGERLEFIMESSLEGEETRYRQYRINPMWDANMEVMGASIVSRDITDMKRQEIENERLVYQMRQKQLLYDAAQLNIEADVNKDIIHVNQLTLDALGYSQEELLNQSVNVIFQSDDVLTDGLKQIEGGEIWEEGINLKRKDGSFIKANAMVTSISNKKGKIISYLLAFSLK